MPFSTQGLLGLLAQLLCISGPTRGWRAQLGFFYDSDACPKKEIGLSVMVFRFIICSARRCSQNVIRSMGSYDAVSYIEANFLQLFLWERFEALAPEARVFKAPQPQPLCLPNQPSRLLLLGWSSQEGRLWLSPQKIQRDKGILPRPPKPAPRNRSCCLLP